MSELNIRRATIDDVAVVSSLADGLFAEISHSIGASLFDTDLDAMQAMLSSSLPAERYFVLLAQMDNNTVGFAALSPACALYTNGPFGILTELYVLPNYRSKAVGAELIRGCVKCACDQGWTRLEVTTPPQPEFERSLDFYLRNGFEITGGPKLKRMIA